jgi:hypothetical protein
LPKKRFFRLGSFRLDRDTKVLVNNGEVGFGRVQYMISTPPAGGVEGSLGVTGHTAAAG